MADVSRLFDLLQALRKRRHPVSAAVLAEELGVSVRTLYRDINRLREVGAAIDGEAGLGYVLQPGFLLPPLMLSEEEIEALTLGLNWVQKVSDRKLAGAAEDALSKVAAILPPELRARIDTTPLVVGNSTAPPPVIDPAILRQAIRAEQKVLLHYTDAQGRQSQRTLWPLAIGFLELSRMLVAWCELRQGFRLFRLDRIAAVERLPERYPRRRQVLYREWRAALLPASVIGSFYADGRNQPTEETAMNDDLVLYTNPWSRGAIAHWMLEEVGVPYRTQWLDYDTGMKAPDFLAINPMGKVPALQHGPVVVTEAAAICAYLADAFPATGLAPEPAQRGDYYRWLFFAAGPLEQAVALNGLGFSPTPDKAASLGCGTLSQVLDTLAAHLRGKRYIAGDRFSAVDVYVGSHLGWGMAFGTIEQRPEFVDYWQGLQDRPANLRVKAILNQITTQQTWAEP